VTVETGTVTRDITAVGSMRANESVIIHSEIAGRIQAIHFSEGESVAQDAELVTLDATEFRAQLAETTATVKVPLTMMGALLSLKLTGGTLKVYSQIGMVMLIGLISKHGILIVEFANQLQERGHILRAAVIEAASLRLRPILMATAAMVLGTLPLALATGAGAESQQQIGWVIVGGLLPGTFLTLFVIPSVYTLVSRTKKQVTYSVEATQG
jgi:Cu/Ag efflux pump CusA